MHVVCENTVLQHLLKSLGAALGTVSGLEEGDGTVIVQWDMGQKCRYRCGQDNKFDLRILGSRQI